MMEQDLNEIEEKSIFILREANSKFKNLAALWSMGNKKADYEAEIIRNRLKELGYL